MAEPHPKEINRNPKFSARLREAMDARGMNQQQLAAAVGVEHPAVGYWLNRGSVPYRDRLAKVASVLGVSAEWLAKGKGPKEAGEDFDDLDMLLASPEWRSHFEVIAAAIARSKHARNLVISLAEHFRQL